MLAPASPTHPSASATQGGRLYEESFEAQPSLFQHHQQHHLISPIPPVPSVPSIPPVLPIPPVPPVSAPRAPKRVQLPPLMSTIPNRASKRARMTAPYISHSHDVTLNGLSVPDATVVNDVSYHFAPTPTDYNALPLTTATAADMREEIGKFTVPAQEYDALPGLYPHSHSISLPYSTSIPSVSYPAQSFSQSHLPGHLQPNPNSYSRVQYPQLHRAFHYHSAAHSVHLVPTPSFPIESGPPIHPPAPYLNQPSFPANAFQLSAMDNANVPPLIPQSQYLPSVSIPVTTAYFPNEPLQQPTVQSTPVRQPAYPRSQFDHSFYQPPQTTTFLQTSVPQFDPYIEPQLPIPSDTSSTNDDTAYSFVPPSGRPGSYLNVRAPRTEHLTTMHLPRTYPESCGVDPHNLTSLKRGREKSLSLHERRNSTQRQAKTAKQAQTIAPQPSRPQHDVEDDRNGHLIYRFGDGLDTSPQYPKGRYKILKNLGEGTFGKVVECWDRCEERHVAIKVVRSIQKYRQAARLEIDILLQLNLNDPTGTYHCVRFLSWFEYHYHMCMVFEKLGPSLYDQLRMNRFKPFSLNQVRDYAFQLLVSVNFVHSLTLIHTDLKPENILLDLSSSTRGSAAIKLIDFGSATYESQHHSPLISTRHYRAPEVILGLGWTYPVDLWSIGCILVELYTGQALFQTHENLEHLAMMSCVLGPIPEWMMRRAEKSKKKYFRVKGGRCALNWPKGASSEASIQSVQRVQSLWNIIRCSDDHKDFFDLVKRLLAFEPGTRCTSAEALQHPFFRNTRLCNDRQLNLNPVRWRGELNHAERLTAQVDNIGQAKAHNDVVECGPLNEKFNQINVAPHRKDIVNKSRELSCSKVVCITNDTVKNELRKMQDEDTVNHLTGNICEFGTRVNDGDVEGNNPGDEKRIRPGFGKEGPNYEDDG